MNYIIIIGACLLGYWSVFTFQYVCDDKTVGMQSGPPPKNPIKYLWQEFYNLHHWNPVLSHGITLAVHMTVCCLIYAVFHNLWAALLFAVNPVNSQCVAWASGRMYALATIVALTIFAQPILFPLVGVAGYWISVNILPFTLVFLFDKTWWPLALFTPYIIFMLWSFITKKVGKEPGLNKECVTFAPRKIILYFKSFGYYTILALFPHSLGFNHKELYYIGINDRYNKEVYSLDAYFWAGVVLFTVAGYLIVFKHSLPVLWWVVLISQWCNLITITSYLAERYVYMANVGLMLFLAQVLPAWVMPYILGGYLVRLWNYLPAYSGEFWNHEYALIEFKDFGAVYFWQGMIDYEFGYFTKAAEWILEAKKYNDKDFKINIALAGICLRTGDIHNAEKYLDIAEGNYYETSQKDFQKKIVADLRFRIAEAKHTKHVNLKGLEILK